MPAVEVIGLTKQFVRRQGRRRVRATALDGVSFTIGQGECVAVLGCNGSGKSTLVRVLSTLLLHDGGSARVFGHDVARDARLVRGLVNRVSVEAAFFKRLSATENLSYAARFYGLTPAYTRRRIPEILAAVGFPARRATAPMSRLAAWRSTSRCPPVASTPLAMKTMVSVLATVHAKKASSQKP